MKGCRPLTNAEIESVAASFRGRYALRNRALFVLGIRTGFRLAELLSVQVRDVWKEGRVLDSLHVQRRNMKRKTEGRTVPIHDEAKKTLAAWLRSYLRDRPDRSDSDPLFPGTFKATKPMTTVGAWRVLKTCYAKAGLTGPGLGSHSMRKSFASRVYESLGHDLVKTQKALGHKNINSTCAYIGFLESEIDQAILAA